MPAEAFRYCAACGWEGIDRETCPDCGAGTKDGGVIITSQVTAADLDELDGDDAGAD